MENWNFKDFPETNCLRNKDPTLPHDYHWLRVRYDLSFRVGKFCKPADFQQFRKIEIFL